MEPNHFMAFMALRLQQQQAANAALALDHNQPKSFIEHNQPLDFSAPRLNLSKYLPQRNLSLDSEGNSPRVSPDTTGRTGSVSPTGSQSSSSSAGESREPMAGSCSPPRQALPRISVPTQPLPIDVLSVRPLASLQQPAADVKPFPFLSHTSLPFPFHTSYPINSSPEVSQASIDSNKKYADFRDKMMKNMDSVKMEEDAGYPSPSSPSPSLNTSLPPNLTSTPTHPNTPSSGKEKDAAYWERRRKNNAAAKRSRDSRRAKEQEVHIRAKFLESENQELRMRLANAEALKQQAVAELMALQAKMKTLQYEN